MSNSITNFGARSLAHKQEIASRFQELTTGRMKPLTNYVEQLRVGYPDWEFPDFDPLDGGVDADLLFLFEKPGPKTSRRGGGSGFISRDNNDPTAEATFRFMSQANIARYRVIIWNCIPGWNGTRAISNSEISWGIEKLSEVMPLLPHVRKAILVGRRAQRATPLVRSLGLAVATSPHPSPLVRASQPAKWLAIPEDWKAAAQ